MPNNVVISLQEICYYNFNKGLKPCNFQLMCKALSGCGWVCFDAIITHLNICPYWNCHNPSLGLATKVRVCKVAGQEGSRESHNIFLGVWEGVKEWTLTPPRASTLGVGILVDSQIFRGHCRGQTSMAWSVPYIIGKLLECRCLKCAHTTHLDIWNTSYGQKKGPESNRQFDSRPLKVRNRPDFLVCRWRAT